MELITHTFFSELHYCDWLSGGLLFTGHDFCFTSLSSSNLKALSPFFLFLCLIVIYTVCSVELKAAWNSVNYLIKTGDFSLVRNYLRSSNNSRQLIFNIMLLF